MRAVELALAVGWTVFWVAWIAASLSSKRGRIAWGPQLRIRIVIAALVVILVRLGAFHGRSVHSDPWRAALGLVLFGSGLAVATWARLHIGRNWGTPMTRKEDPELVTSGPYRRIRHPIYAGILLAGVGTAVALAFTWLVAVGLAAVYFLYSARVEERNLTAAFPVDYPRYKRSTKMLVPFVF